MSSWDRLIRFEDASGTEQFGEPIINASETLALDELAASGKLEAKRLSGSDIFSLSSSDDVVKVKKVLSLLSPAQVPIVKCVGLNYMKHSKNSDSKIGHRTC